MDELLNEMKEKGLASEMQVEFIINVSPDILLKAIVACEITDYFVNLEKAEAQVGKLFEFSPNLDHKVAWVNPLKQEFAFGRN